MNPPPPSPATSPAAPPRTLPDTEQNLITVGRRFHPFVLRVHLPINDREGDGVYLDHTGNPILPRSWCEGEPNEGAAGIGVIYSPPANCLQDVDRRYAAGWGCFPE